MSIQDLTLRPTSISGRVVGGLAAFVRAIIRRRRFKRLHDLDDHILEDIGVTRAELEIATRLPFSRDAADEVRRLSLERRRHREAVLRARYRL